MAPRRVAHRKLQERHWLLRVGEGSRDSAKERVVYAASHKACNADRDVWEAEGQVEADETYIGSKARNMHKSKREQKIQGRGTSGKVAVMGLLERHSEVRTKVVPDTKSRTLQVEVRENVEPGSEVHTDALASYRGLDPSRA